MGRKHMYQNCNHNINLYINCRTKRQRLSQKTGQEEVVSPVVCGSERQVQKRALIVSVIR